MKSVFRLLPFLFLLGLSAYLPGVRAETCRANIGQTTVNIPNIKYLPTLPVNTQMTSAMADNGSGIPMRQCDAPGADDAAANHGEDCGNLL